MTADIIDIKSRQKPNLGNGAREALLAIAANHVDAKEVATITDYLLAELWVRGFKVVPLDGSE
jgi:hypothetical protein